MKQSLVLGAVSAFASLSLAAALGCGNASATPGVVLGTFTFQTEIPDGGSLSAASVALYTDCVLGDPNSARTVKGPLSNFTFDGLVSYDGNDPSKAWFTYGGVSRDAGFDGQLLVSTLRAERVFSECSCTGTAKVYVEETIALAVLSGSQNAQAGDACPEHPLDGGVVVDADAGVLPPALDGPSTVAPRACGELVDVIVPDISDSPTNTCSCPSLLGNGATFCTLRYPLAGQRKN